MSVVILMLLISGCGILKPKPAVFELKFSPEQSDTYRLTTKSEMSLDYRGPSLESPKFKDSRNYNDVQVVFTQQVQDVDQEGFATVKITIEKIRYLSLIKDNLVTDFNSSDPECSDDPMAKLIGKSYTIKISPTGQLVQIIDMKQIQAAVKGRSETLKEAQSLLLMGPLKRRHSMLQLPKAEENLLTVGDSWSKIQSFSFPIIGTKVYERIYTVGKIKTENGHRIATVQMQAIPTVNSSAEQKSSAVEKIFDNIETYTGQLKIDLTDGKIQQYQEQMDSKWVIIDRQIQLEATGEPDSVTMGAMRSYQLERIDPNGI